MGNFEDSSHKTGCKKDLSTRQDECDSKYIVSCHVFDFQP